MVMLAMFKIRAQKVQSHNKLRYRSPAFDRGNVPIRSFPLGSVMMLLTQDRKIMGNFVLPGYLRVFGWAGTLVMSAASIALLFQLF